MKGSSRLLSLAAFAVLAAVPAAADITVEGRYVLVNGDTITRASYYSRKRVRLTAPDGKEFIYDTQAKRVTVVDHDSRRYFSGTIDEADSTASHLLLERRKELKPLIEANQDKWLELMKSFNDSLEVMQTQETRKIAGYPCTRWILKAGSYMTHERWVAAGLSVPNYGPELEKIVLATVLDPLGRQLMKLLIQMRERSGTVLASSTQFHTLTQDGAFSWEAVRVSSDEIPKDVWDLPKDYIKVKPMVAEP